MVYLIGAGAGDVGLLTIKAVEILKKAEVVIYDRLADEKILNYAPEAKKIYVGKSSGQHTFTQEKINKILVEEGKNKKVVVRLKGGDPFVFGRGGEECLYLRENGVEFEIISGVTSAISVPAYAGIPVTHRGIATSFAVVTGHEDPTKAESTINWKNLSTGVDTLIFLMGIANLAKITEKLIENGRDKDTPAAIIENGTKFSQKVLVTTLENAADEILEKNIKPPAIFIVGEVVKLREKINWFEKKVLFGKKILNTRARLQASKLTKKLEELGAEVIEFPTIKITNPTDNYKKMDFAIKNLQKYDWIIFTSTNGVEKFFERLNAFNLDSRAINAKIAVIGSATAEKLKNFGIIADLVPKEFFAESLIESFKNISAKEILIVRAEKARDILPEELKKFGAEVEVVPAYKTISAVENVENVKNLLNEGKIDFITFTSSSTVENFVQAVGAENLKKVKKAAIGPITAQTLKNFGIDADIIAKKFTIEGLVDEICKKIS